MENVYNKIWKVALRRIAMRPQSRYELKNKLLIKFPDCSETILKVLDELERVMLLDDQKFAEHYLEHLMQKNVGRMRIMIESRKKGLDNAMIETLLLKLDYNEVDSAKKALESKLRGFNEADERKRKQKLIYFLRSRGFRDSVIYQVI